MKNNKGMLLIDSILSLVVASVLILITVSSVSMNSTVISKLEIYQQLNLCNTTLLETLQHDLNTDGLLNDGEYQYSSDEYSLNINTEYSVEQLQLGNTLVYKIIYKSTIKDKHKIRALSLDGMTVMSRMLGVGSENDPT